MKFKVDYFSTKIDAPLKLMQRILAASDWSDCVNKTKRMIDDGYKITGIAQVPEHVEVTPWTA